MNKKRRTSSKWSDNGLAGTSICSFIDYINDKLGRKSMIANGYSLFNEKSREKLLDSCFTAKY